MPKVAVQIIWSIIYTILGGLVFVLGLNYLRFIPENLQDAYKFALPLLFLVAYIVSPKVLPDQKVVFLAYFLVSLGWILDYYLTGEIVKLLSLDKGTVSGFAFTMVISTLLVTAPVIIGWLLAGQQLSSIYLQGWQNRWGILVGLAGLILFGGLGVLQALNEGLTFNIIMAAIPMALVFSLANGFREELVYRAVFLKHFQANIGLIATIIVTTLVFAAAHINVSYSPADLVVFALVLVIIGIVGSLIMVKTGSLFGAVLFHAGADVLLIMGLLSSHQLTL